LSNVSSDDLEDILQEVFLKSYLNLNGFDNKLKFSSWIYRITHNQVISRHPKFKARPEAYACPINEVMINKLSSDQDLVKDIDLDINKENISKILYSIDEKYRDILVLKFLEEKTYQEISDIIKKPEGTVASMINKAKDQFRKEIQKQKINF
jgi:RNA polymerase sigma-70 factor (ECF subfamily)